MPELKERFLQRLGFKSYFKIRCYFCFTWFRNDSTVHHDYSCLESYTRSLSNHNEEDYAHRAARDLVEYFIANPDHSRNADVALALIGVLEADPLEHSLLRQMITVCHWIPAHMQESQLRQLGIDAQESLSSLHAL